MKQEPKDYNQNERILWKQVDNGHDPKVDSIPRPESASARGACQGGIVKTCLSCLCWGLISGLLLGIVVFNQGPVDLIVYFCYFAIYIGLICIAISNLRVNIFVFFVFFFTAFWRSSSQGGKEFLEEGG